MGIIGTFFKTIVVFGVDVEERVPSPELPSQVRYDMRKVSKVLQIAHCLVSKTWQHFGRIGLYFSEV